MEVETLFIYEEVAGVVSEYYHPPFPEQPLQCVEAMLG